MNSFGDTAVSGSTDSISSSSYWPAQIYDFLNQGKYARVVELCLERLEQSPELLSVRLAYGRALYQTGQIDSATEQFRKVLGSDPENLAALKYLGDIRYAASNEFEAIACYSRILELDPTSKALRCEVTRPSREQTKTVALTRAAEEPRSTSTRTVLRQVHFYTETMGDLYLAQGHPRMAAEVFGKLSASDDNPRLLEKKKQAIEKIKEKER
ncbi:MAG: tetratricopeptide repeat protein [bacterium]|nr:tetratricopeptide repeat protein [bacterium]